MPGLGKVDAGTKNNIIPNDVRMQGTIRSSDSALQEYLMQRIREAALSEILA